MYIFLPYQVNKLRPCERRLLPKFLFSQVSEIFAKHCKKIPKKHEKQVGMSLLTKFSKVTKK
jgi:hypothetical protein